MFLLFRCFVRPFRFLEGERKSTKIKTMSKSKFYLFLENDLLFNIKLNFKNISVSLVNENILQRYRKLIQEHWIIFEGTSFCSWIRKEKKQQIIQLQGGN